MKNYAMSEKVTDKTSWLKHHHTIYYTLVLSHGKIMMCWIYLQHTAMQWSVTELEKKQLKLNCKVIILSRKQLRHTLADTNKKNERGLCVYIHTDRHFWQLLLVCFFTGVFSTRVMAGSARGLASLGLYDEAVSEGASKRPLKGPLAGPGEV